MRQPDTLTITSQVPGITTDHAVWLAKLAEFADDLAAEMVVDVRAPSLVQPDCTPTQAELRAIQRGLNAADSLQALADGVLPERQQADIVPPPVARPSLWHEIGATIAQGAIALGLAPNSYTPYAMPAEQQIASGYFLPQ